MYQKKHILTNMHMHTHSERERLREKKGWGDGSVFVSDRISNIYHKQKALIHPSSPITETLEPQLWLAHQAWASIPPLFMVPQGMGRESLGRGGERHTGSLTPWPTPPHTYACKCTHTHINAHTQARPHVRTHFYATLFWLLFQRTVTKRVLTK